MKYFHLSGIYVTSEVIDLYEMPSIFHPRLYRSSFKLNEGEGGGGGGGGRVFGKYWSFNYIQKKSID